MVKRSHLPIADVGQRGCSRSSVVLDHVLAVKLAKTGGGAPRPLLYALGGGAVQFPGRPAEH